MACRGQDQWQTPAEQKAEEDSLGPVAQLHPLSDSHLGPSLLNSKQQAKLTATVPLGAMRYAANRECKRKRPLASMIHPGVPSVVFRLPASDLLRQISTGLPYYLSRYTSVCLLY